MSTIQVGAGQNGNQTMDFDKYRSLYGNVRMRLTDITLATGRQFWSPATIRIRLVDSHGVVRLSGTLQKTWGVMGAWVSLGTLAATSSLRFRVEASVISTQGTYDWIEWKADLAWG